MADRWRQSHEGKEVAPAKITSLFLQLLTDPYRCLPLIVFGSGFLLNFTVGRETIPTWLDIAAEKMILLNLFTSFLAVGFTLKVGNIAIYAKPILALAGIKFIASPLIAIIACQAIGLTDKPFTVVIIEAACPVGIFSVLTAALYRQDAELAGAALVSTTAFATVSALILIPQFIN
jgi:predicted permease